MNELNEGQNPLVRSETYANSVELFLENQRTELELSKQKLEIDREVTSKNQELEKLELQQRLAGAEKWIDYDERKHERNWKYGIWVIILMVLLCVYCLYLGKEEIVKEVLTTLGLLLGGGLGGYQLGIRKRDRNSIDSD